MKKHIFEILRPAAGTPSNSLPDGAIAGNGDLTVVLSGSADRVRIHIGKADFWKAAEKGIAPLTGGLSPLGLAEILLPQLAYADYRVEQNLDEANIVLRLTDGKLNAELKITVCAEENTILLALDRSHPAVSASIALLPLENADAIDETDCRRLLRDHDAWWKRFWSKRSVELPDEKLELYWYAGLYAAACCMRNKKFPPGLWGAYATEDGMQWFGDYHLNYNYQAPFYALTSSNHTELIECYTTPLNDYLPIAKQYAREFLGIEGALYPVGIGPLGMEADCRPYVKEHGRLFHGQKSNGAYSAVIPMMHWYGTRDKEFAKREYYDFLLSVAQFWENYLVFEDGTYHIYSDALNEVCWYTGPDAMPQGHDDKDPIVSRGLVRMLMKLMIDLSEALDMDTERIPKWQHILDHLPTDDTFECDGKLFLRGIAGCEDIRELALEYIYPAGQVGKYSPPELFEAAKNTHRHLNIWDSHNRFCSYYPEAARLGYPAEEIVSHIHEVIETRGLPNGMFRYMGGGLENSSAIPTTVNEILLQSFEDVIRLFPVWKQDASFHGLRANGAFLIDASQKNGRIHAQILSEQGMPLTLESPGSGYVLLREDGRKIPVTEDLITTETCKGERIVLLAE